MGEVAAARILLFQRGEADPGVTNERERIEGIGALVSTPGPRQGGPGTASWAAGVACGPTHVLEIGGPLARRAGLHTGRPRTDPYNGVLAAARGGAAGGAMGCEELVHRLVERIYDAAVAPESWGVALEELSKALGDPAIQLSLRIRSDPRAPFVSIANEPGPIFRIHLDERYHEIFLRLSLADFPWAEVDRRAVLQRFVRSSDMLSPHVDLERTSFYREFMRPQGLELEPPLCHVIASADARPLAGMVIYRRVGCRPFAPDDFELLDRLAPHLARAYRIHCRFREARHERRALREVLDRLPSGVILLDKHARAVFTNRSAEQILALEDGIRVDRGRPRLDDPQQDRAFQELLEEAVRTSARHSRSYGRTLSVVRPSGRRSYATMVGPLLAPSSGEDLGEAVAILFVADPEGSQISTAEVLEGLYDLTPAEAELLRLLAEGHSLDEVALRRGITRNTARSQLKQVFAKTDTRRQGELVRLVLTGVASLGDDGER